jgi:short-subunit dehydrogenase
VADEISAAYGVETRIYPLDLSQRAAPDTLISRLNGDGITLRLAVNDAGIDVTGRFVTQDWERLHALLNLNLYTTTALTKYLARQMEASGGGIVINMASLGGLYPMPYHAVYGATKAYILSMTEAVAYEMRGSGVTFTAAAPGLVQTQMFVAAGMRQKRWRELAYYHQPRDAVRSILRAAMHGKPHRIPGLFNKAMALIGRFTPRAFNTWYARELMREREPYP